MPRRVWLFDLDDTLHHASARIFPQIDRAMTAYVARTLEVDDAEANRLRLLYWQRYGATLTGLMRHHGTDPHDFLRETHPLGDIQRHLVFDRALKSALNKLKGRKIVFSNAPRRYAEAVLQGMGVRECFAEVWCLEQLRFVPKPLVGAFRRLLHKERIRPECCIMVEDNTENLRTAKALGMMTVLVTRSHRVPSWVDVRLGSVLELPRRCIGRPVPTP